jgi:HPt (histidine-containing phosphotransfer) domain-containing protein
MRSGGVAQANEARGVVDFEYLETFCAGDMQVVAEVLAVFRDQAQAWAESLADPRGDWRALSHTIKGSARAVGARALGEAAEQAENLGPAVLPLVRAELTEAMAEVEGYLSRIGGG